MDTNMKTLDKIIKRARSLNREQQEELLKILNTWQDGKEREYKRFKANSDIDVVINDKIIQTRTEDISASGVFIKTAVKFELHESARVVLNVPGYDKPIKLEGVVARAEEGGVAINFEKISPYFKKILDDIIWENLTEEQE